MLDGEVGLLLIRSSWLTPMSTDEVALRRCEFMATILIVIVSSNLLFALLVFVLIGKPSLMQGWLAKFVGLQAEWQFGSLSNSERDRINTIGRRLGYLSLWALFVWSFLSGVLLRLLTA